MGLTAIASDTAIGMPIATAVFRDRSTNSAVNDNPRKSTSSVNAIVRVQPCPSPTGSEARSGLVVCRPIECGGLRVTVRRWQGRRRHR